MKNNNFLYKTTPCIIRAGVLICIALCALSSYLITHDIKITILCFAIALIMGTWAFITLLLLVKILSYMSADFGSVINEMINETYQPNSFSEEDTIISKMNYQLSRLYGILQSKTNRIYSEKDELQQFISDISHQVRSPITNAEVAVDSILELKLDECEKQEYLLLIRHQMEKLKFLMDALIKVSRLETGMLTIKKENKPIYETLAQALGDIVLRAEEKSLYVSINCPKKLCVLHDTKWTIEAIYNILDNAVKYTEENGEIYISVSERTSYVIIDIEDTGKGIPEKNLASIFQRFYREPEVHNIEGNGLGLFLSRKILTLQDGYIQLSSKPGKGTTVSLYFLKS